MTWRYAAALLLLLMTAGLAGCVPFVRYHDITIEFKEDPDGVWVFRDEDITITFSVGPGAKFNWFFKNTSMLPLRIDHRDLAFYLEDDPNAYTLWGMPRDQQPDLPVLALSPGDFIRIGYPVQVSSPMFPFNRRQALLLDLIITWNGKPTSYRLVIPARSKPQPPAEDTPVHN